MLDCLLIGIKKASQNTDLLNINNASPCIVSDEPDWFMVPLQELVKPEKTGNSNLQTLSLRVSVETGNSHTQPHTLSQLGLKFRNFFQGVLYSPTAPLLVTCLLLPYPIIVQNFENNQNIFDNMLSRNFYNPARSDILIAAQTFLARKEGGGFLKSGRLWGRGFWEMRTSAKFWELYTKFDINLDKTVKI